MKIDKKLGVTILMVTPFAIALWVFTRPPATSTAAAKDIFDALSTGDSSRIYRLLRPEEQKALGLNQGQSEKVLTQVLIPAFQSLNVRVNEKKLLSGDYEMYFMAPCSSKNVEAQFTLGLLEYSPGVYQTSLSNLYAGIVIAESRIAKKSGNEKQIANLQKERIRKLSEIGMKGLYNASENTVQTW
jgi:hypothetical protein